MDIRQIAVFAFLVPVVVAVASTALTVAATPLGVSTDLLQGADAKSLRSDHPAAAMQVAPMSTGSRLESPLESPPVSSEAIGAVIRGLIERGVPPEPDRAEVVALYVGPVGPSGVAVGVEPLWLDAIGRPTREADEALAILGEAPADGLDVRDYDLAALKEWSVALRLRVNGAGASLSHTETAGRFDVALSRAMLRFLRHVHVGRVDPRRIGFRLNTTNDQHDFPALLRHAVRDGQLAALVDEYRPPLAAYDAIRRALADYRAMPAELWVPLRRPSAHSVRTGDRYEDAERLRRRLNATKDLPVTAARLSDPEQYDAALSGGVARFQSRHGLAVDGVLGPATFTALAVPLAWRVRQLELALERQRWLPHVGRDRLVVVNIPMFSLWTWDTIPPRERPAFGTGVVVGRALSTETPVFAGEIHEIVFQPYWNIPRSIVRDEVLPALGRDPGYLVSNDMEIVRGPGDDAVPVPQTVESIAALASGTLRVRQRPGVRNALGQMKFVFPNENDIYMHGTPAQELFTRHRRDFSHGCVRVEDPVGLAEWALAGQPGWDRAAILAASSSGPVSRHIPLARPVRVVLFYTTAIASPDDGAVHFAEDIYRHDVRLDRALRAPGGDVLR